MRINMKVKCFKIKFSKNKQQNTKKGEKIRTRILYKNKMTLDRHKYIHTYKYVFQLYFPDGLQCLSELRWVV